MKNKKYKGIFAALILPFKNDHSIDEKELRKFSSWLTSFDGMNGLLTNGHSGEIFSLSIKERAHVTRIVRDEISTEIPLISAVGAEGIPEALDHSGLIKEAGANAILVMPPHHWIRFGMQPEHVIDYFNAIGKSTNLDLIVHVYPSWTKASYNSELLGEIAKIKWVKTFKIGTREMSKYAKDISTIRNCAPEKTILTCHDEYLLASMVQGVDGALVGFASFLPKLIIDLFKAVKKGDLFLAQRLQSEILPFKEIVYGDGDTSTEAHARMKTAMMCAGILKNDNVRPPVKNTSKSQKLLINKKVKKFKDIILVKV